MGMALLPPGLYTEALASPPMPYASGLDYALEDTEAWKALTTDTDLYWQDVNGRLNEDWDHLVIMMEDSSEDPSLQSTQPDNSPVMP